MVLFRSLVFRLAAIFCAAAASQSLGGIVVERGLPDGIYQAVAVQGPALEAPPTTVPPPMPSDRLSRRSIWNGLKKPKGEGNFFEKPGPHTVDDYSVPIYATRHSCHKDHHILLNSTEYRRAVDNLWDYCQNFMVPWHGAHFSIVGDVMVYVCAYASETPCHRHEWNEAEEIMDKKCGQYKGSHIQMSMLMKEYGRTYVGKRVCSSTNFHAGIRWQTEPLPVWVDGKDLGYWKAGPRRYKAGDSQYGAEDEEKKMEDGEEKNDKMEDGEEKKDKTEEEE